MYVVFKVYHDPDYEGREVFLVGVFDNLETVQEICKRDVCKGTFYRKLEINKEDFIEI